MSTETSFFACLMKKMHENKIRAIKLSSFLHVTMFNVRDLIKFTQMKASEEELRASFQKTRRELRITLIKQMTAQRIKAKTSDER